MLPCGLVKLLTLCVCVFTDDVMSSQSLEVMSSQSLEKRPQPQMLNKSRRKKLQHLQLVKMVINPPEPVCLSHKSCKELYLSHFN